MKIESEQIKSVFQEIRKELLDKNSTISAEAQLKYKAARKTGNDAYTQADFDRDQSEIRFNKHFSSVCSRIVKKIEALESEAEAKKAEKIEAKEAAKVEEVVKKAVEVPKAAKPKRQYTKHKAPATKAN